MGLKPAFIACALLLLEGVARAADITLVTEDYPPYNYLEDGEIIGFGADQAVEIMQRAGVSYELRLLPWSRAVWLADTQPNTCVLTTSHTPERDLKYLWVEPLDTSLLVLAKKSGSRIAPKDLQEARRLSVGTQREDYAETVLRKEGFHHIDLSDDMATTVKNLMLGRIDLAALSEISVHHLKTEGAAIEPVLVLAEFADGLACNLNSDPDLVGRLQAALDSMIADGTQKAILSRYK